MNKQTLHSESNPDFQSYQDSCKFLECIFKELDLELALDTIKTTGDIDFYDDLLRQGKISFKDLMEVIRFQPGIYNMFKSIQETIDLLIDSIANEKYKYRFNKIKEESDTAWKRGKFNTKPFEELLVIYNNIHNLGGGLDLQFGMLRTIAFNYFSQNFELAHFSKIMQFIESTEDYDNILLPFEEVTRTNSYKKGIIIGYELIKYEKIKRNAITFFKTSNFLCDGINEDVINFTEIQNLAENKNVQNAQYSISGATLYVINRGIEKNSGDYGLFLKHMELAEIIINIGHKDFSFIVYRDGTIKLKGYYNVEKIISQDKFFNLQQILFQKLRENLESAPEDDSLVFPDIFSNIGDTETGVIGEVEAVLDNGDDKRYVKLGSIKNAWLHRRLTSILGEPIEGRGKGSHKIYKSLTGKTVPVPKHTADVGVGLLRAILKQLDISPEELKGG